MRQDARIPQREIAQLYDELSGGYDTWARLTESHARNRAIELAEIKPGQNILEVAVGTGLAFFEIVKRNPTGSNTGFDISEGMLKIAERRLKELTHANYTLSMGTAFDLQVEDASIDLLMNNYMFDLIPHDRMDKVLEEFKRALKPGGKLVLINMTEGEGWGSRLYELIYKLSPRTLGGCRGVRMTDKLKEHGFPVERREYYQQMLFPSEVILAYK